MLGIIGDIHFKEHLGYSDYIGDHRVAEEAEVLDTVVNSFKDCDTIVSLGDQLHGRNNPSRVLSKFVAFFERFRTSDKKIYMLAGNHEKFGDGSSAIDFLKELKDDRLTLITNEVLSTTLSSGGKKLKVDFCPYFTKSELEAKDKEDATAKVLKMLNGGDILFVHHAISGGRAVSGTITDLFDEVVLPMDVLKERYKVIVGGHIHQPQEYKGILIAGSLFTNEVGERSKSVWKLDPSTMNIQSVGLPVRPIIKVTNPDVMGDTYPVDAIIKVVLTNKNKYRGKLEELKTNFREVVKPNGAFILLEQYPNERKKLHYDEDMLQFDVEKLLHIFAGKNKIEFKKMKAAWNLIK